MSRISFTENEMSRITNIAKVCHEAKDPVAKTHPCMVPYANLPEFQREKDALFLAIVRALA